MTCHQEVSLANTVEIAGTLGEYQRSVDFLAGQAAPRVFSHALADPSGSSTWRGADDEHREVGGVVSGQ